jgi:SNF2 family DNA or RNA helicase
MADIGKGAKFVYSKRGVPMNSVQKKLYTKTENVYMQTKGIGLNEEGLDPAKIIRRLNQKLISAGLDPYDNHRVICRNKAVACVEYWEYLQEPVLVVSTFREPMLPVIAEFEKAGARVGIIHGDVKYEDREKIRLGLQEGRLDVVVAQTRSIEVGLNFSAANTIMVVCNSDSGASREQLVERINSMDATSPKEVLDIISIGSNDDKIMQDLERKGNSSMSYFK